LHRRRSAIYSSGVITPYPFQVNTHGLPSAVVRDCLLGFVQALIHAEKKPGTPDNFFDWIHYTFGPGFAEHFFLPFNEKFFKTSLKNLTPDWASWSVPRPELRDVINGALGIREKEFGYNVEFYYPEGGIEDLVRALASSLARPVQTSVELKEVMAREKRAILSTGEEVRYDRLLSTVPLDRLIALLADAPAEIKELAKGLKVLSVLCVNLGINGPSLSDQHWLYVPEPGFIFHRIGFYSNFMRLPAGKNALYLEITLPGPVSEAMKEDVKYYSSRATAEFRGLPPFRDAEHTIEVVETMVLDHGYVLYNRPRKEHLPRIMAWLREQGIEPLGRYGRWEYSTMEDALRQGREAAEMMIKSS